MTIGQDLLDTMYLTFLPSQNFKSLEKRFKKIAFRYSLYSLFKITIAYIRDKTTFAFLQVVDTEGKAVLATLKAGSYFGEISILNMGTAGLYVKGIAVSQVSTQYTKYFPCFGGPCPLADSSIGRRLKWLKFVIQ